MKITIYPVQYDAMGGPLTFDVDDVYYEDKSPNDLPAYWPRGRSLIVNRAAVVAIVVGESRASSDAEN